MKDDELDVLLVEDNPGDVRLIEEMLRDGEKLLEHIEMGSTSTSETRIHHEKRLSSGLDRLSEIDVDVILLDLGLPDSNGLDTLAAVLDETEFVPIIVLTGLRDEEAGIEAVQRGAQDYLVKDEVTSDLLVRSIYHAIERNRQERERVRRQRQLEALNALSRDLMEAETQVDVSEYLIESAEEMLDLSVAAIVLYDDEDGTLRPAATTAAAAELLESTPILDRGTGAGWNAFVKQRPRREAEGDLPGDRDTPVRAALSEIVLIPLDGHGLFLVGATVAGGFSSSTYDVIETVAANVEAALDRARRERQLHDREETLREQNESLERLNRINDIIRSIDRVLVTASTREEIVQAVCDRLVSTETYQFAWLGTRDPVTDAVVPEAWAGNEDGFLETVTVTVGSDEGTNPTEEAVRTRETQVRNNLAADPPFEPWRQAALDRGYRAGIAVPLVYQGSMYGVLTLYADRSNVFDQMERDVLMELGETIGYALNALQRKEALVSKQSVELEFQLRRGTPPLFRLAADLDCEFTFENVVQRMDGPPGIFITVRGAPSENVLAFGERTPEIEEITLVSERDVEALFEVRLHESSFFSKLIDRGALPQSMTASGDEGHATIHIPQTSDARTFVELFQEHYEDVELVGRRKVDEPITTQLEFEAEFRNRLTERQEEFLKIAYVSGFFEWPRETTAQELAETLDVSQPTVSRHIRSGERTLFELLFDEE